MTTMLNTSTLPFPVESVLELIELTSGNVALRPVGSTEEPLVAIQFSNEMKAYLADSMPMLTQHMIQAALQAVVAKQQVEWHTNVMDERPEHYS